MNKNNSVNKEKPSHVINSRPLHWNIRPTIIAPGEETEPYRIKYMDTPACIERCPLPSTTQVGMNDWLFPVAIRAI